MLSGQHKILEHPHPYGTGVISQPYIDSEMEEIARKIVKAYNWRGFLGIEFMRNKKSGKWVVIEINLRPWISVNFQAMLGFNYIAALYNDMYGINESAPKVMTSESFDVLRVNMKMLVKKELAEHDNEEAAFDEIINILKKSSGKIIFSYYIQGDPKPGETEKQYLLNQYPNQKEKIEYIYELIKENNDIFESKKCR